jgi:transaldolase
MSKTIHVNVTLMFSTERPLSLAEYALIKASAGVAAAQLAKEEQLRWVDTDVAISVA